MIETQNLNIADAVKLAATSGMFYSRYFFPKTCRRESPDIHKDMWGVLDSPSRYKSLLVYRDGAKTTLTRLFGSRRIAYRRSRTIQWVGKSEAHAQRSIAWLAKAVEYNHAWAQTYGLAKGGRWNDSEIEIIGTREDEDYRCTVLATGITGSVRGVNVDDYRPDTIVLDDICDPENTSTKEQRQTMENLVFADLYHSLASSKDVAFPAMISLATPLDPDDVNMMMQRDPMWQSRAYSIFTQDGESSWPDMWTTDDLLKEKASAIANNRLSLWMREKEVTFISKETSDFDGEWLVDHAGFLPDDFDGIVMSIDPVPPPSPQQIAKNLSDKDYEVLAVCGIRKGVYYLLEYCMNRGHTPEWTVMKFFYLLEKWHPSKVYVESVNYQRTLAWLLEEAMKKRKVYCQIMAKVDMRSKPDRINDSLHGPTSQKLLRVNTKEHTEFVEQFTRYPAVSHDDVLEAVAVCVKALRSPEFQYGSGTPGGGGREDYHTPVRGFRRAP